MPWLAALLATLFSGLISWFAKYISQKAVIVGVAVVQLTAMVAAFKSAIDFGMSQVSAAYPVLESLPILPANTSSCISVIIAARTAGLVYKWACNIVWMRTVGV